MNKDFSMYKYYKGEDENPFDQEKQNAAFNFWGYEKLFEMNYNEGDFSEDKWVVPYADDIQEWKTILSLKPVNKQELFKLWLYNLLMNRLPDRYQSDKNDEFLNLYYD